jgi:hypothetical protein
MRVEDKPWGKVLIPTEEGERPGRIIQDRRLFVLDEDFSLEPDSLIGSVFHVFVEGEIIWQGAVVAEPQAGRYLCDIDTLEEGVDRVQRLFALDTLMGLGDEQRRIVENAIGDGKAPIVNPTIEWRLYDTEAQARAAFANWTARKVMVKDDEEVPHGT